MSTITTSIWHYTGGPSCATARQEKEINDKYCKGRNISVLICRWNSCLNKKYERLYQEYPQTLPELVNQYTVTGYKLSIQNKFYFYTLSINNWKTKC